MKTLPNGTCTTPPWAAMALTFSSLRLRSKPGVKWRSAEWLAITGTLLEFHRLLDRVFGQMRDVDHDAEAVHFLHHLLAERTQTMPTRFCIGGRVADAVVAAVGEGDVTHAACMEFRQIAEVVDDGCTVLHAQGQQHFAAALQTLEVVRRTQQCELVRMASDQCLHRIDLRIRDLPGLARIVLIGRGVDRHEGDIQAACARAL